ncbi:uncharacterized protein LOC119082906 [Bradysia coprophila]|uniref:uncharacterized protein LOC119082906 n=1 Tax=Bradysia coprophila TaxID=38358 RepID=UPI00187DBE20|nr:uncharacterized protein LOC119082906 [Bradysia coprophila]
MKEVTKLSPEKKLYFIPHHAVVKPDSLTTKLRVVFDASAKTSSGRSLNQCMHIGARQQSDLFEILIRWRRHKIAFKADIEKMYRQIKLDTEDQRYHTILWREQPATPIKEYQLTTATFGTAAAPFMATRTLRQIADDAKTEYPLAEHLIKNDFYVDDFISGSNSLENAIKEKDEVIKALQSGGMTLRKWTSNDQAFLRTIPDEQTEKVLQLIGTDDTKALGIRWNPRTDHFGFEVQWASDKRVTSKRELLSEASKLYDPLGWLAPIMIKAKLIMQQTYTKEIGWDDPLPESIVEQWSQFKSELPSVTKLRIRDGYS